MEKLDYTEWKDTLKDYLAKIDGELAAVRKAKEELYEMQRQLQEMVCTGRYERDDDTLILSAPNIIIGNVDKQGNLMTGTSNIVIRGNNVNIEGVGQVSDGGGTNQIVGGCVTTRARTVKVQTVDPGPDGLESVAFPDASFSVQSSAVAMTSEKIVSGSGVYTRKPKTEQGNINVSAETAINVTSAQPLSVSEKLEDAITSMTALVGTNTTAFNREVDTVGTKVKELSKNQNNKILDMLGAASDTADTVAMRTGLYKFEERAEISDSVTKDIAQSVYKSTAILANMAETKRVVEYFTAYKNAITSNGTDANTKLTGSSINLRSEVIRMRTDKADGKLSTVKGNGLDIESQNVNFNVFNGTAPIEDTTFRIVANNVAIDTNKYITTKDSNNKTIIASTTADGSVVINSKTIKLSTANRTYKQDDKNEIEKETIENGSSIILNTFKTHLDMSGNQGDTSGEFLLNAKTVNIISCNTKPKDGSVDKVTDDSSVSISAATVNVGTLNQDQVCKMVQIAGETTNVFGKDLVALKQETNNSQLKLDASAELGGVDTTLTGNITLGGATKIDCDFTANKVDLKNLNIGTSFKSPNMNDGVAVTIDGKPLDLTKIADRSDLSIGVFKKLDESLTSLFKANAEIKKKG